MKKQFAYICLVILCCSFNGLQAQITFQKKYAGTSMYNSTDIGYSMALVSGGGYIIAGTTGGPFPGGVSILLLRLDSNGDTLWTHIFGGISYDYATCVIQTPDKGFIVTGSTNSFGSGNFDALVIKTDSSGNLNWAKTFGGANDERINSVVQANDGGYVFTGTTSSFGMGMDDIYLIKTHSNGSLWWEKSIGSSTYSEQGNCVNKTADGGYIITGRLGLEIICLMKTDADGNAQWIKAIHGAGSFRSGQSVVQANDKGYIVAGYVYGTSGFGHDDVYLVKTDSTGALLWSYVYGGPNYDIGFSVQQTSDNGIVVAGVTQNSVTFAGDLFLIKTNSNGILQWSKTYGQAQDEYAYDVKQTSDGGFIVLGYLRNTNGNDDIYLIKTDGNGNSGCNETNLTILANPISTSVNNSTLTSLPQNAIAGCTPDSDKGVSKTTLCYNSCTPPSALITPGGPTTFCIGGSVTLNAPVAANRTYQWKKNNTNIAGATLSSYTATTTGNYKVTVTNTLTGCSKTTAVAAVVTVNAKPAATITPQGPTTFCAGGNVVLAANTGTGLTYKWKKNNNFISGATLLNYTATTAGTYRVEVTKSNGCTKLSAGVAVTVPCKLSEGEGESENKFDVKVFPNPSSGDFVFEIQNSEEEKISISVYDMPGKLILSQTTTNSQFTVRSPQLVPGVYSAVIKIGENRKVLKLVKNE